MGASRFFAPFVLVFAAIVPLSCGGGGGPGQVTISEQNAQTVAAQGVRSVDMLTQMTDLVDMLTEIVDNPSAQVVLCDTGTANIVVNDVPPVEQLSTGDSASFSFNGCVLGEGPFAMTFNGGMSFTATEVTGSEEGPYSVVAEVQFNSLSFMFLGVTVVVNGGFTIASSSTDGVTFTNAVSGTFFSAFATGGGETFSGTIRDFSLVMTVNEETGAFTAEINATVSGNEGTAMFETTVPFTGMGDQDPSSGVMVVTGAYGSTATIVALDEVNVRIDVDLDGDEIPDVVINTTWDVLDSEDEEISGSEL